MDLRDNIRLNTQVDLADLLKLSEQMKELKLNVTAVASAARVAAEIQKAEIRSILAAEKVAEDERDGRSERRRLNKLANIKAETQAELDAIRITDAASKASYNQQVRDISLYNAELRKKSLETRTAQQANNGLFSSLNSLTKIRSELITLFGAYSLGSFAEQMIDAQSKVQAFELSMKNLLGGAYGSKLVADLKQFTVQTPLNFEEVIGATNTLVGSFKAAGASSKTIGTEIPQILESLGNSAAALGGENRLGRLIYAFSQVQATGRLMGTEVRQITETGFPLLAVLTDSLNQRFPKLSLNVADVQKRISDGKVSFDDFKIALLSAGEAGGVFAGGMQARMATVAGSIDKLKESTFFALSNIGNQFNESAKRATDFLTSTLNAFFGTEKASAATISAVKQLATTFFAYKVVLGEVSLLTRAYAALMATLSATKTAYNAVVTLATSSEQRNNIVKGEAILINRTLTGSYNVLTASETAAAAAATSFNRALGVIGLAMTGAYIAYELYSSISKEASMVQDKMNESIRNGIAPLRESQIRFNSLANSVLEANIPLDEQNNRLENLRKKYPELLNGVKSLAEAEKILKNENIDGNRAVDYRNQKLAQLKKEFPEVMKGVDDLADAEKRLRKIMQDVNGDFAIRMKLLDIEIRTNINREKLTNNTKELIELEGKLAKASKESRVIFGEDGTSQVYQSEAKDIETAINARKRWISNFQAEIDKAYLIQQNLTEKLKFEYDKDGKNAGKAAEDKGKDGKEKALKYQEETIKQKDLIDELEYVKSLQKTRQTEQAILDIELAYDKERIQNAIGSKKQKDAELTKLDNNYRLKSAELSRKWNKEEAEEQLRIESITLKEINDIRSTFRAINSINEKESLKEQQKAIEDKYKLEMESILKSNMSNAQKRVEVMRNIILEEKEISTIKLRLEQLKTAENLRGEAAKKIKKDTDDINEKSEFRNKITLEQIEHEKDLAQVEAKRYDSILALISGIADETKEVFNFNDAINKSKIANEDLIKKKEHLADIISKGQLLTKEGAKAQKEADDAVTKSVEATNQVQLLAYTTLLSVAQKVFEGIKKSIVENMLLVNKSYEESNKIFQEFVVKKRQADLKAYEDDLDYRLKMSKDNLDKQLSLLEEYFDKAQQLIKERDLADAYAAEFESLVRISNEKSEFSAKLIQGYSLNGLETIKNMVTNTLTVIGKANDGLTKEQEMAYRKVLSTADTVIQKLEWQRDNTVDLLDKTIDVYKDKYSQQTQIVKDETDKQIQAVNSALSANLSRLSDFYDAQGNLIKDKYGDILDGTVRYTDEAFKDQLSIWSNARIEQENIIKQGRDSELGTLKQKYQEGKITLDEYLKESGRIQEEYSTKLVDFRTKFYADLEIKTNDYYQREKKGLDTQLANNLISQQDYDDKLDELNKIQKQRSGDLKDIIKKDRDDELAYLKTFYYDAKIFEEQRAADAIVKINEDAATKLQGITATSNAIILDLENKKRETILSYNSQIFEENRRLALAQAELAQAEAKAAAWKNPFTARGTIKDIEAAFAIILSNIANAVNPFMAQLLQKNILDNQTPVVTDGNIQFEKGTDNTSVSLAGQRVVDNKGGWTAILHPQEAVFSKADMSQMETVFGKRPTRQEVIETFKLGVINQTMPQINPYVIQKMQANGIGNFDKLSSEIRGLAKEVSKKMTPVVYMDKGGVRVFYKNLNTQIEVKNQRFR